MTEPVSKPSATRQPLVGTVNVRSVSLIVLASVSTIYFIDWAQAVILPLVVAVLISYALDPLVSPFDRLGVPRPISAAFVVTVMLAAMVGAAIPLQSEALAMLDKVPEAISKFQQQKARVTVKDKSILEKAQAAAKEIEATARDENEGVPGVTSVRIVDKPFNVQEYLLGGASTGLVLISQGFSSLFLVYFLLSVGKLYRRKVVRMAGPSFGRMRQAARIMADFHHQVRRFLFVMLLSGVVVGAFTWFAFIILGVEEAGLWGVVAGVASVIPYLGPFLVFLGTGMAGFLQFGTVDMALVVAGVALIITSIQGYLLTPWLTSHLSSLNPVAIFVGLLFGGWLWGAVGLVIATPVLMVIKSLCDHVVNLRPLGEMLGK